MRTAVEAVSADLAFRQTDGGHKILQRIETQRVNAKMLTHMVYHTLMSVGMAVGIFIEMLLPFGPLQFEDHAAGKQFHLTF